MSWFIKSQISINNFTDRNLVNDKIHYFEKISDRIYYMGKIAFQSQLDAKKEAYAIAQEKTMTSYPDIVDILSRAGRIALDSPWKFRELCAMALTEVDIRLKTLVKERKRFTEEKLPAKMRGWIDDHSE